MIEYNAKRELFYLSKKMKRRKGAFFMKKNYIKKAVAAALCAATIAGMGNVGIYAEEITAMTEEEKEQKSQAMKEWMEQYKEEYEYLKSLSGYEQVKLIIDNPEKLAQIGCDRVIEENGFLYGMNEDVLIWMESKDEKVSEVVLSKEVKKLWVDAFSELEFADDAKIILHEEIEDVGGNMTFFYHSGAEIVVEEGNEKYCSVDGVLFSKDMKTLIAYPREKKDVSYVVPDSVECINVNAFGSNEYLQKLQMGDNIKKLGLENVIDCEYKKDLFWGRGIYTNTPVEVYIPNNEVLKSVIDTDDCKIIADTIEHAEEVIKNLINGGDLNGDEQVTLADAQIALKAALNIEKLPNTGMSIAAVSDKKDVTINDAKTILELALGIR